MKIKIKYFLSDGVHWGNCKIEENKISNKKCNYVTNVFNRCSFLHKKWSTNLEFTPYTPKVVHPIYVHQQIDKRF